jgi:uncharacterized protein (DUF849 family)
MDECIISAALSGVAADRSQCPAIPYTPEEYASEARRAADEGAAAVHLHARTADGRPSHEVRDYAAIADAIRAEVPELIINFSTGAIGVPREQRALPVRELRPDVAALNCGSMTFAKYSRARKRIVFDHCFENTFETISYFLDAMNDAGVHPECECFDTGHLNNLLPLIDMGTLRGQVNVSLVLGVLGGAPATAASLAHMSTLVPASGAWQLVGVSREQWPLVDAALELGGHVRVGLEDNFYLPSGEMAASNGELVRAAAAKVRERGRSVATAARARELLGLPVRA